MGTQVFSSRSSYAYAAAEWQPDIARYRREVEEAIRARKGDPLTLAEMECSLELVDADLAALRSGKADTRTLMSQDLALEVRRQLQGLITTMRQYCRPTN
jgi:hypothetical protein